MSGRDIFRQRQGVMQADFGIHRFTP